MKASIIICTFNSAKSLKTNLECLEWQTFKDFEVIVVDESSTDNTYDILQSYANQIKLIKNTSQNRACSRNMGLKAASGEIICFIEAWCEPDSCWLANVMYEFGNKRIFAVTGPIQNAQTLKYDFSVCLSSRLAELANTETYYPHSSFKGADPFIYTHSANTAFRKECFNKLGGFIEDFVSDFEIQEFCARLIDSSLMISNVKHCSMLYRREQCILPDLNLYHFLKNSIYLIFFWNRLHFTHEELILKSQEKIDVFFKNIKENKDHNEISLELFTRLKLQIKEWFNHAKFDIPLQPENICFNNTFLPFNNLSKNNFLRICFCVNTDNVNTGNTKNYLNLASELAKRGHEIHIISPEHSKNCYLFKDNINFHYIENNTSFNSLNNNKIINTAYQTYLKILELRKTKNFDIIIGSTANYFTLFSLQDISIKNILTLCTTYKTISDINLTALNHNKKYTNLHTLAISYAHNIHSISDFIITELQSEYPNAIKDSANVFHIPIGINPPFMSSEPCQKTDKTIRILFVGRLETCKAPDILLAALAKILPKYLNIELYIAGADNFINSTGRTYRQAFQTQYLGSELEKHVHFLGMISDEELSEQYALCDIFCAPSIYESFGTVFIEAMAYGKPVIGCRAGGMPEVISEGKTGLLAEPDSVDSLVTCLETLICDSKLRLHMGKAARKRYEKYFTLEKYAENMEKEFYRIANKFPSQDLSGVSA